jgi:hypothetical protein
VLFDDGPGAGVPCSERTIGASRNNDVRFWRRMNE